MQTTLNLVDAWHSYQIGDTNLCSSRHQKWLHIHLENPRSGRCELDYFAPTRMFWLLYFVSLATLGPLQTAVITELKAFFLAHRKATGSSVIQQSQNTYIHIQDCKQSLLRRLGWGRVIRVGVWLGKELGLGLRLDNRRSKALMLWLAILDISLKMDSTHSIDHFSVS